MSSPLQILTNSTKTQQHTTTASRKRTDHTGYTTLFNVHTANDTSNIHQIITQFPSQITQQSKPKQNHNERINIKRLESKTWKQNNNLTFRRKKKLFQKKLLFKKNPGNETLTRIYKLRIAPIMNPRFIEEKNRECMDD